HLGDGPLGMIGPALTALLVFVIWSASLCVPAGLHATDDNNVPYLVIWSALALIVRGFFPAFFIGAACVSGVRHALGGEGRSPKHLAGLVPAGLLVIMAFLPAILIGQVPAIVGFLPTFAGSEIPIPDLLWP